MEASTSGTPCSQGVKAKSKGYSGWVISTSSPERVDGVDLQEFGFKIIDHRLYPDDLPTVSDLLKDKFTVDDVTPASGSYETTAETYSLHFRLTPVTAASKFLNS